MNWKSRPVIFAASFIGLLAAGLAGAALYLSASPIDLSNMREAIISQLNAATGRDVKITGKISLGLSFVPTLDIEGLQIQNEPWGKAEYFLKVAQSRVRIRLFPLFRGQVEVVSLSAKHAEAHLETDGEKRRNWNILAQAVTPDGVEAVIPAIDKVELSDIKADFRDISGADARFSLHLDKAVLSNDAVNGIGSFEISGKLNEDPIRTSGNVAPLFTISPEQPRQFDASAKIAGMHLRLDGSVKFPFKEFTYADFMLDAPKGFTRFAAYFGLEAADYGPVQISGNVTPFGEDLHFGNMTAKSGASDASGFVIVKMSRPPRLRVELRSKFLDLSPYIPATAWPEGKIFPVEKLFISFPASGDFNFKHQAEKLRAFDQEFTSAAVEARLTSAELRVARLDADMAGGRLSNSVNLARAGDDYALSLNTQASGLDLAELIKEYDLPKYAKGKLTALFEGNSRGASPAALAASLNGRLFMDIKQGAIPAKLSTLLAGSIKNLFTSFKNMFTGKGKDAVLECGFAGFVINHGFAETKTMLLVTDKAVLTGKGNIDLRNERVKLRLSPRPRDPALLNLATDVDVEGPLIAPESHLNEASLAKTVGKTAVGVALGPLGLILGAAGSAVSSGKKEMKDQCARTRAAAYKTLQTSGPWPELQALR